MPLTTRWSMAPPARTESSIVLRVGDFGGTPWWWSPLETRVEAAPKPPAPNTPPPPREGELGPNAPPPPPDAYE